METTTIALAYCIDNLPIAEGIEKALSGTNYTFAHHYCKKTPEEQSLTDQLQYHDGPIILLISDNFLRSLNCMNRALNLIQTKSSNILPVVVDGRKYDEDSGQYKDIATKFEKIGDIIPYINYWQNQYLDLRTQRKSIEAEEGFNKESFSQHLRTLRQVSSEASEFLRVLRNMPHYPFEEFQANHFEALFQFLEDEEEWEAFKASTPELVVETQYHTEAPGQEDHTETEEEVDLDLSEIPGIELLEGSENIAKIIKNKMNDLNIEPVPLPEDEEEENELDEDAEFEKSSPDDLFETHDEEEESDIEEDIYEDILDETNELGGPASSKDDIQEEHAADLDPSPENFSPEMELDEEEESGAEVVLDSEEDSIPFDDPNEVEDFEKQPDEIFEEQKAEFDDTDEEEIEDNEAGMAEDAFQTAHNVDLEQTQEIIDQAFLMVNSGQLEDGITYMDQASKRFPDSTDIKYNFALMLAQNTSDFSAAIDQLSTLLEIEPDHLEANFLMGELSEIQEHYKSANKYYKKVSSINPAYQNVNGRLGFIALNQEAPNPEKAYKYFKRALKHNPENIDAIYQYALLLNEIKGKSKKAIKHLKTVLKMNPEHAFANYDLALLYYQLDNKLDARFYYQKAIEINPELKTEENDLAFGMSQEAGKRKKPKKAFAKKEKPSEEKTDNVADTNAQEAEADALGALKANIKKLENLLAEKTAASLDPPPKRVDKIVFITGATSGIGLATARLFAAEGYRIILNGRRSERLEELKQELVDAHESDLLLLPFDVSDVKAVQSAVDSLPEEWKNVDFLINNAGKAKGFAPIHEGELVHWEEMIDVNLKGLLYLTRAVSPGMVARQSGHIINVCSTAGKEVYPNGNVYCATKFAVDALTKAMRIDLHKHDIRVSQVSPGHVEETEFAVVRFDGDEQRAKIYEDFNPLTSSDVAETIYFIANRPKHVNIQDILMMGTQQAGSNFINRSGRENEEEE